MEIFGVGPLEFVLILVIALVILGPEDMVGTARKIGQWIYRMLRSPTWRAIMESTKELRDLPQQIVRDAGLQDAINDVKQTATDVRSQMNETTRQISGEMSAATRDIDGQVKAATGDVAKELSAASTTAAATALLTNEEIRAATFKKATAEGESAAPAEIVWTENSTPGSEPNAAVPAALPEPEAGSAASETVITEDITETPPETGGAAPSAATEEHIGQLVNPYASMLETYNQALGKPDNNQSAEPRENVTPSAPMDYTPPQLIVNEMTPPAAGVTSWGEGAPSAPPEDNGFEARMQNRMEEMLKSIEKLDQATPAPAPPGETPAQLDENIEI